MKNKRINFLFLTFLFISFFLFLRLYHLKQSLNFGSDQGTTLLDIYNLYQSRKITLITQSGASWTLSGRYLFFSSLPYYVFMPFLILFKWNPLVISYFFIVLQLIVGLIIFKIISDRNKRDLAILFMTLWTFTPLLVDYSRFVWFSNFIIPLGGIVLSLLLIYQKSKRPKIITFLIGLICGIGFVIHFSFILAFLAGILWFLYLPKTDKKRILLLILGFIFGISPLLIFELRHNFYNLRTVFFLINESRKEGSHPVYNITFYYLFSLLPFFLYFFSILWLKVKKKNAFIFYSLSAIYIIYSSIKILAIPSHGFTMPPGWNYQGIQKAATIIISQNKKSYNLVDLLTGDTRAASLRYLLTINGRPPQSVNDYPNSQYLFMYTKEPIDKILKGSLWELDVLKPLKVTQKWYLQNGIYLYLLEKDTSLKPSL